MKKLLKILFGVIIIAMAGFIWMFETAAKDVEQFCELAPKFKTWSDLEKLKNHFDLKPHDLSKYVDKETTIVFHTPRSYGRHTCAVEIKNNQVIKATFRFLD
jgi:hypothetical protein